MIPEPAESRPVPPPSAPAIEWYFDVISPFAYLQSARLHELARRARLQCIPVLFAGLLEHWGNKGPAEIAPKRRWTFEHVTWLAQRHGIALTLPPAHPFVSLPLLRLSIALGDTPEAVGRIFRFVWAEGRLPSDAAAFDALLREAGVARERIDAEPVKRRLRENTERAARLGVFGVPTIRVDDDLFWGFDATEMALARLDGDPFFAGTGLARARDLPQGVQRPRQNS